MSTIRYRKGSGQWEEHSAPLLHLVLRANVDKDKFESEVSFRLQRNEVIRHFVHEHCDVAGLTGVPSGSEVEIPEETMRALVKRFVKSRQRSRIPSRAYTV